MRLLRNHFEYDYDLKQTVDIINKQINIHTLVECRDTSTQFKEDYIVKSI